MAGLSLEHIWKKYPNGYEAVKDFNLEIADKEFIIFVGPSGCGKSTTLRMIAGLEDISSGTLKIGDRVVNDVESKDRDIAMVFQNYALYPHMTIYDNMAFALKLKNVPKDEIDKAVNSKRYSTESPRSYQEVNVSVWQWDVQLSVILRSSSWTSLSRISMQSYVFRCVQRSRSYTTDLEPR